jgi:hypothetical protein
VDEYPLPPGSNITHVHVLHRHGSRYPSRGSGAEQFGATVANLTANGRRPFSGELSFLNDWRYELGAEILTPGGRQELYDSGVPHWYNYGRLLDASSHKRKLVARTTTMERMLESAESFLAGFFGWKWKENATLEVIIDWTGFNNSLAASNRCPNTNKSLALTGDEAAAEWARIYLADPTRRFQKIGGGLRMDGSRFTKHADSMPLRDNRVRLQPLLPALHVRRVEGL